MVSPCHMTAKAGCETNEGRWIIYSPVVYCGSTNTCEMHVFDSYQSKPPTALRISPPVGWCDRMPSSKRYIVKENVSKIQGIIFA